MTTELMFVYVTTATQEEALNLGRFLVEVGLAACANVAGPTQSVYRWEGQTHQASEWTLVLKSRQGLIDQIVACIRERHSYELPCIVALPIIGGNPAFLDWIRSQTNQSPELKD